MKVVSTMRILASSDSTFDINLAQVVLTYTNDEETALAVMAQLFIGSDDNPALGTGAYFLQAYINDSILIPHSSVIAQNNSQFVAHSRNIVIAPGDTFTLEVVGLNGDASVDIVTRLIDVTQPTIDEVIEAFSEVELIVDPTIISNAVKAGMNSVVIRPTAVKLGVCSPNRVTISKSGNNVAIQK